VKQKYSFVAIGLVLVLSASAQSRHGGISEQMLQAIRQQQTNTVADRALRNAIGKEK